MYASIRVVAIWLFAAATVAPALSTSLGSEMVSRDKSLDIGNDLHLRQDQDDWNQDCKAYYGSQDCYMSDEDASGVPGATWACICPSYGGGDSSCSATYNNGYCYYDQYITIPGLPQGACACPVPPPNTSPPPQ
ncbi:hypothetical protein V8E53_009102 [Lactarius tabidus]